MHPLKLILGIDTSTSILDVAIFNSNGNLLANETSDEEKTHSQRAMIAVDNVLKKANKTINDISVFAACTGAGSYTGVRIGVSIAKGLALATGGEYKTISSFDLMAHGKKGLIIPIIDARRGAVFASVYEDGKEIIAPRRIALEELKEEFKGGKYTFIQPHGGKWQGITLDMLGKDEIIYLGGSV
jgi:tRNA threonylcarbamoyladenosine biosynthesis protein TsaB